MNTELYQLLKNQAPVSFQFIDYDETMNNQTLSLLSHGLAIADQSYLENIVFTVIKELINNAAKANLKRAFFLSRGIAVNEIEKYPELMLEFNSEAVNHISKYIDLLKKNKFYVTVSLLFKKDEFTISISNNLEMTTKEKTRIQLRFDKAIQSTSFADIYEDISDSTESAGLGIALNIMLLKNVGIDASKNFHIHSTNGETVASLLIPKFIRKPENTANILKVISQEVHSLPSFPENISRILQLCQSGKSNITEISQNIKKDPALSLDILRIVNQSGYFRTEYISDIFEATKILGLKVIHKMVLASSVRTMMSSRYETFKGFWEHANQCAFYSKSIANYLNLKSLSDVCFLGGLFHDLGKMVLTSIRPEMIQKLYNFHGDKVQRTSSSLEEASIGISHSSVGAMLAAKWGLSKEITAIIKNHHSPFSASEEYRKVTSIVHIADALIHIEKNEGQYNYIDLETLNQLKLRPSEIKKMSDYLQQHIVK